MTAIIFASLAGTFFGLTLTGLSVFLILIVLVQRGKGGGLTGALGGPGGQSAFGTKAGDMFTKITAGTALIWVFLCAASVLVMGNVPKRVSKTPDATAPSLGGLESVDDVAGDTAGDATPEAPAAPAAVEFESTDEGSSPEDTESAETEGGEADSAPEDTPESEADSDADAPKPAASE